MMDGAVAILAQDLDFGSCSLQGRPEFRHPNLVGAQQPRLRRPLQMAGMDGMMDGPPNGKEILLDMSKKELGNPQSNCKKLHRRLKQEFRVSVNKDVITLERLQAANLVVFAGPRDMFTADEFAAVREYVAGGGSIFILLGEGGEAKGNTNVNYLLEEFGISVNNDAVVRTAYYKYLHPKEAFISNGILCEDMVRCAKGERKKDKENEKPGFSLNITKEDHADPIGTKDNGGLDFVFPYGATLNVQKPAVPILSS